MNGPLNANGILVVLRRRFGLALAVLSAVVLSFYLAPSFVRRDVVISLERLNGAADFSLRWLPAGQSMMHGAWLDPVADDQPVLEILPSGSTSKPDVAFEFWLYSVKTESGREVDLKRLISKRESDLGTSSEGWIPFEHGPGVVYVGKSPGSLEINSPGRLTTLSYAHTDRGGPVVIRFGGTERPLDTLSLESAVRSTAIPYTPSADAVASIRCTLPNYDIEYLELRWRPGTDREFGIQDARVVFKTFGLTLFERHCNPIGISGISTGSEQNSFVAETDDPTVELRADFRIGKRVHVIAAFLAAMLAYLGAVVFRFVRGISFLPVIKSFRVPLVVFAIVGVNALVAWNLPVFVTSDGIDYIDAAERLATTGSFDRFPPYKAPGLSVVLAGAMLLSDDFLQAFGWIQAAALVGASWLAYGLVRLRASRGWALLAAALTGLHPTLLAYQNYLLREVLSVLVVAGLGYALVRIIDRANASSRVAWLSLVVLSLLVASGAYLRENFQMFVLIVPVALVFCLRAIPFRTRIIVGASVMCLTIVLLLPRVVPIWRDYGGFGVVSPKTQVNRAIAMWENGIGDGNDTAFFSAQEWQALREESAAAPIGGFEYLGRLFTSSGANSYMGYGHLPPGTIVDPRHSEAISRAYVSESASRKPIRASIARLTAFVNQIGLWNIRTGSGASSDEWYSKPLRGEAFPYSTNFATDVESVLTNRRHFGEQDRLRAIIAKVRKSTHQFVDNPLLRFANEWFWVFRAARPVLAVLFLAGVVAAIKIRDRALVALGCLVLVPIIAAAVVVATPTDRFGVPFIPLLVCVSVMIIASRFSTAENTARLPLS